MQSIIWVVQFNDHTQVRELEEDGKENIFDAEFLERKGDFRYIGLMDVVNDVRYSVDLENGDFILREQRFNIAKEMDGRTFPIPDSCDFRDGVIQFKCSKPMILKAKTPLPTNVFPESYNIGYKVKLPDGFCETRRGEYLISISHCQAMLSIDADTGIPRISTTWTAKHVDKSGKERFAKV